MIPQKTLTPFTAAELELCFEVLNHSLSHPCHKCLELESLVNKINYFRLKAMGIAESNPAKVFPHGIKKKRTSKFELDTPPVSEPTKQLIDKTMSVSGSGFATQGTSEISISEMEKMAVVGNRTEKKRKYNKSKLNQPKPPFGLA